MNGEPKPPEPLQLLRSWGCPGACHGLWQCSLEDLPEKTVQEDAPLLLENHALPPTPLSGSTSLDHFALIVLQLPGRREAPAVNLARTICSAPRKLQGKWLCEYSKNNNRSICLGSCGPQEQSGDGCSHRTGLVCSKSFLRPLFSRYSSILYSIFELDESN